MYIPEGQAPPRRLFKKFFYYSRHYSLLHVVCSYVGRHSVTFWRFAGPLVTRSYIRNWLITETRRVLNLGGGSNCLEGCLSVDVTPRADAYVDITRKLPFPDSSVDAIFCEEVIEHIDSHAGRLLLKECWRILKPGGVMRLSTPDLTWFAARVITSPACCDEINEIFYGHDHRYLYTPEALRNCCSEVGFTNIRASTYRDSDSKLGHLDSHAERFNHPPDMSQYLDAEKPSKIP